MMYSKKFVASVKAGGKIMREQGETVFLPFGSEYSLLLKNLNNRKALVNIEIDGQNVMEGGLVVYPNQTIDLERFLVDGDLSKGPKFRFIEKTEQISDHRGDKVEDGIIRVSYRYEAEYVSPAGIIYTHNPWDSGYSPTVYRGGTTIGGLLNKNSRTYGGHSVNSFYSGNINVGANLGSVDGLEQEVQTSGNIIPQESDAGITVHGGESKQKFSTTTIGMLEMEEHIICLNIRGQIGEQAIREPVTVSRKIKCDVCGKPSPTTAKFCGSCSANLTYQY